MLSKELSQPVRMVADVTRRCNLSCWYCRSSLGPNYSGPELSSKDLEVIFNVSEAGKIFEVTLSGGEPILWPGLKETMYLSHQLDYTSLQIITNATVLSQEKIDILNDGNLRRVCVSIDGSEQIHERNRGPGTYRAALEGIEKLRGVVNDVTVISLLDTTSYNKWPELTRRLVDLGVSQHHLAPVRIEGVRVQSFGGLTEQQFEHVRKMVDDYQNLLPPDFTLKFNDIFIQGPQQRTLTLSSFTEFVKGWHITILPDGSFGASTKAQKNSQEKINEILAIDMGSTLDTLKIISKDDPNRLRVRLENGFSFIFDTKSFDVTLLTANELNLLLAQ